MSTGFNFFGLAPTFDSRASAEVFSRQELQGGGGWS